MQDNHSGPRRGHGSYKPTPTPQNVAQQQPEAELLPAEEAPQAAPAEMPAATEEPMPNAAGQAPPRAKARAGFEARRPAAKAKPAQKTGAKTGKEKKPARDVKLPGFLGRMNPKQLKYGALVSALVVVLALSIVLAMVVPGCQQAAPGSSSGLLPGLSSSAGSSSVYVDTSYNMEANSIPVSQYAGTLLEETNDAGQSYVDETLFLGDSNTARMHAYRTVTGVTTANALGVESMGITSVTGLSCVRFKSSGTVTMVKAAELLQPRRLVINFGTNNAGTPVKNFIESYRNVLASLQKACPQTEFIIASVLPVTSTCRYGSINQTQIDEYNLGLVELAQELGIKFLNWSDALRDAGTGFAKPSLMLSDGVHINEAGAKALFEYFRSHSMEANGAQAGKAKDVCLGAIADLLRPPPPSSSQSVSASSTAASVSVSFSANTGGSLKMGDVTQSAFTVQAVPGTATGTVTAVPAAGYKFKSWTIGGNAISGSATLAYTVPAEATGSIAIVANFEADAGVLVPQVTNAAALPAGWSCSNIVEEESDAAPGTVLRQTPAAGSTLPAGQPQVFTEIVIAKARAVQPVTVNVTVVSGSGCGTAGGGGAVTGMPGSTVTVPGSCGLAGGHESCTFAGWSGGADAGGGMLSFTIPGDATNGASYTITANFTHTEPAPPVEGGEGAPPAEGG